MCSRCAGTRPGPGPVDFGPDQTCRHTDKTLFLVVPAHFASPALPAHCAGTRYTQQGVDARGIFFRSQAQDLGVPTAAPVAAPCDQSRSRRQKEW